MAQAGLALHLGTRRVKRMALSQGQFLDCRSINRSWVLICLPLVSTPCQFFPAFSCKEVPATATVCSPADTAGRGRGAAESCLMWCQSYSNPSLDTHTQKRKNKKERRESKTCPGRDPRVLVCPESPLSSLSPCLGPPELPQSHPLLGQVKLWFKHCKLMWKIWFSSLGEKSHLERKQGVGADSIFGLFASLKSAGHPQACIPCPISSISPKTRTTPSLLRDRL